MKRAALMKRVGNWRQAYRWLAACTILAATASPVHADVLTFDSLTPVALLGGESVFDSGYAFTAIEGPYTTANGLHSGTGAVLAPNDPGTCEVAACPSGGNGSNFWAGQNDGGLKLSRLDGKSFSLTHLDFAFLAPMAMSDTLSGQLVLNGVRAGGGNLSLSLDFGGQDAYGNFMFNSAALGVFNGAQLSSVSFSACIYSDFLCVNSLDQPAFNEAQFALDNIGVSAVPEPSTWAMLVLGILVVLAWSRRRIKLVRAALTTSVLVVGAMQGAHAHMITVTGDTTGAQTYLRPSEGGQEHESWRGSTAFRVIDVYLKEDADLINFTTTCAFDCGMFVYEGSFNPVDPYTHYLGGDDNYVGFKTAALGGGLYAGHYAVVITGDSAQEFGYFTTTIASTAAFSVSAAVPETSTWLMLGAGLALLGFMATKRRPSASAVRLALTAGVLMLGVTQQARADIVTFTGDTTWGDTFHRPGRNGGTPSDDLGLDVAYRAYNISVSSTDWQHQSILTACDFNCVTFLYRDAFDPLHPMKNIIDGSAEGDGRPGLETWLNVGQNYVLVIAGFYDFDWGVFSTTIGSAGGINVSSVSSFTTVSSVPEPSPWLLFSAGLAGLSFLARRRRTQTPALI